VTMAPNRRDPDAHRERVRAANLARSVAFRRLRREFAWRWEEIYAEEAARQGVTPQRGRGRGLG
jgi:hypothetical protein